MRRLLPILLFVLASCSAGTEPTAPTLRAGDAGAVLLEDFSTRQIFPADNWWNLDVSAAPLDPQSDALIDFISGRTPADTTRTQRVHPDFGPPPYGIPYV